MNLPAAADFAWAVIGPGAIAHRFAQALPAVPGARLHSVLGRDSARAQAFAQRWSQPGAPVRVAADLPALLADPAVRAIYIATPHSAHAACAHACLAAGKPVLCEKPLVPTLAQGQALVAQAAAESVFLMEALWTRFLPAYAAVGECLRQGAIGTLRSVQSSFAFETAYDPAHRLFNPALAGGALLDIGIYNLAMTRWALQQVNQGRCPEPLALRAHGQLAPSGVDQHVAGLLHFAGGVSAQFLCALDTRADNHLRLMGSQGHIELTADEGQGFWAATGALLHRHGQPAQALSAPMAINGFEYQIAEVQRCVQAGLLQSPVMPHSETLALLSWLDALRAQLGVRYPFE